MTAHPQFTSAQTVPGWRHARYDIEQAAEAAKAAFHVEGYSGPAYDGHVARMMQHLRTAIEAIGPETLGYQPIDRMREAAAICGCEAEPTLIGRMR